MPHRASSPFLPTRNDWVVLWLRTAVVGSVVLVATFVLYEVLERRWMIQHLSMDTVFALHRFRGMGAAVLIGTVSVYSIWRARRSYDAAFAEAYRAVEAEMKARITAGKQLEALLRYQEKLAALGVLAAGIAHDIANPLASMSSELEMIEGETDLARVRESVGVLRGQVRRIDRTLREMTDFARRRGDVAEAVPLHVAVDDALRMVRHDPRARKISFDVEIDRDLPEIQIVEDHLVMVLVNLLINAFDAMPGGGRLTIRSRRAAAQVRLSIADTGSGMTGEVRARALEPLFTTKERGTGLGLSVSDDVIRAAGGQLSIESSPGEGTTVTLCFPAGNEEKKSA